MQALMKEYAMNQYQLADAIGKTQPLVSMTMSLNRLPEDIRNACRTNPNFSKNMLLEVASMKSEASMRRKLQNLIAKADKTAKKADPKEKISAERALITRLDELAGELEGLPWSEWSEDDRNDLTSALANVNSKTGTLLTDMNWSPAEEEESEESPPSRNLS